MLKGDTLVLIRFRVRKWAKDHYMKYQGLTICEYHLDDTRHSLKEEIEEDSGLISFRELPAPEGSYCWSCKNEMEYYS